MALNPVALAQLRVPEAPSIEALPDGQLCCNRIEIGGISLAIRGTLQQGMRLSPGLEMFGSNSSETDIQLNVSWAPRLTRCEGEKIFESGGVWSLYRECADFVFDFNSPSFGPHPYKRLRVREHDAFHVADLTMNGDAVDCQGAVHPLDYPADELLFTNYLARQGLGVEVHGCGLVDEGNAYLFLGHSGVGKSTTTRLWKSLRQPEILSDDRIILRMHQGELWMYGTPWHGEAGFASPGKARVKRIFILQQGPANRFHELSLSRTAAEVFARSFPPFYSPEGLDNTVAFLGRALSNVPCYEFEFTPDVRSIDAVLGFRD